MFGNGGRRREIRGKTNVFGDGPQRKKMRGEGREGRFQLERLERKKSLEIEKKTRRKSMTAGRRTLTRSNFKSDWSLIEKGTSVRILKVRVGPERVD